MTRLGRRLATLLAALIALTVIGCPEPPAETPPPSTEALTRAAGRALSSGDATELEHLGGEGSIRIEIRETLVETDERSGSTVAGGTELAAWHREWSPRWSGPEAGRRWPGGLFVDGRTHCFGDCCDVRAPGGMELETLYLRRTCFANRTAGRPTLSMIVFAEAK